jgi:FlaA1/EpsC-like NDP-sugar epimerase
VDLEETPMIARPQTPYSAVRRAVKQFSTDGLAWIAGLAAALWLRFDFGLPALRLGPLLAVALGAVTLHALVGHRLYLYRGRYAFGSFEEVRGVAFAASTTMLTLHVVILSVPIRPVPASTPLIGGTLALVLMLAARYTRRVQLERTLRHDIRGATPVVLFGAGNAASQLLRAMFRDTCGKYLPVGLLDDDPAKRHLRICDVPVLGGREQVGAVLTATGARTVIFAVPSGNARLIREVRQKTLAAGAAFKVLPSVAELLDHRIQVSDIRDAEVVDLLGRHQIETGVAEAATYVAGHRVLVTGAGGSIGSELCRQIHRYGPAELIMLDRDESALHAVQLAIHRRALLDTSDVVLADIRDAECVRRLFAQYRPDVVFHAAALKHLPLLEQYPGEAVKTNVWGTLTVLQTAAAHGVQRFVNISTDKAADPSSVLGYSKRITERLTAHVALASGLNYVSVRFGNVLGSRGSVLTTFAAQVAAGSSVTVTHPDATRYFMTVQEAVQLTIQAAAVGRPGEALVLDMGEPVRIADLAQHVASHIGHVAEIVYTGLRPGEKLHERLFGSEEFGERLRHPLISHVGVPALDPERVAELNPWADPDVVLAQLAALCEVGRKAPRTTVEPESEAVVTR